jgi:phospholipase D
VIFGFVAGIWVKEPDAFLKLLNTTGKTTSHLMPEISSNVETCFTPPSGCGKTIAKAISKAQESIYMQAYGLTAQEIVDELVKAHNRGVKVRVLLDKSNLTDRYTKMQQLISAGIDVSIDKVPGIAHNKVIIIDKSKVITGSFNFTNSADNRNAENVIIIKSQDIAEIYLQNWLSRKAKNQK